MALVMQIGAVREANLSSENGMCYEPEVGYRMDNLRKMIRVGYKPSRRVVTSTWWEGLVLPMIPRAMPAGA
jgi:hypothetical protein